MLPVLLAGSVALQAWAWRRLRRRVVAREVTRIAASVRYGGWAVAPLLLFVGFFFGLAGLEELFDSAIIPELLGRAALPIAMLLLGVAALGWLCFSVFCAFSRRIPGTK
jgi:hypothetical protein